MSVKERPRTAVVAPNTISQVYNQLGILVLDGSGSMTEPAAGKVSKAEDVNQTVRNIFTRFHRSRYARNFSFAVVTFDENAQVHTPVTPAVAISDDGDYDPTRNHGGGTNIGAGLREAKRLAEDFLRQAPPAPPPSVVLVVMSDGRDGEAGSGDPAETLRLAEEIKRNGAITICSTYFATAGGQDTQSEDRLKALSSDPSRLYETVHDAETLRDFFLGSLSINVGVTIK